MILLVAVHLQCRVRGSTYLQFRHVASFLASNTSRGVDSHLKIILIGHGNHVAIIFEFDLEAIPDAELLFDGLHELPHESVIIDEDVARVAGMHLDTNLAASTTPATS